MQVRVRVHVPYKHVRCVRACVQVNKLRGGVNVAAVKAPGFGDRRKAMLQDLATLTGGEYISEELGIPLEKVELSHLGSAAKIRISKDATTIIQGSGKKKAVSERAAQIRVQIEKSSWDYDKEKLEERLAKLTGGVAVISLPSLSTCKMEITVDWARITRSGDDFGS